MGVLRMIQSVAAVVPNLSIQSADTSANPTGDGTSFGKYLSDALNQVNQAIVDSQNLSEQLAAGQVNDLHTVMIAAQKATLELQLATQVRDKVISAYQDVMRMQV
jgi:flagellar hook-basal body complex protein FliE